MNKAVQLAEKQDKKMNIEIVNMGLSHITEYVKLFVSVFNSKPWNDRWTEETALLRLENMMKTNTFIGKALYSESELKGFIYGQKEYYYNGIHFQIQEFCVKTDEQKRVTERLCCKRCEMSWRRLA